MALGLPFFLLALGIGLDACSGFSYSRSATSVATWLAGILAFGALWMLGEGAGEWILSSDKVTDPLAKRVLRLLGALLLWGGLVWAIWFVHVLVTA